MIHTKNGNFESAFLSDDRVIDSTLWSPTSLVLNAYPNADRATFDLRLTGAGQNTVSMHLDEELLRDLREAINVALGEG